MIGDHVSAFLSEPDHHISVTVENTETLLTDLSAGKIDFALIEGYFDRSRYAARLYRKEPFVGLCGKGHIFANKTIPIDKIWDQNLLLREEGSGTRDILGQLLAESNHSFSEFERITTINNFGLITRLLENNNCITFAYRAVGENNSSLSEFHVMGWDISREFNYVYLDTPFSEYAVEVFSGYYK
ncbi:MAG: hypothetical protein IJN43_04125 [Ruminococcus sp.]|nr:hypothetical protein [Ruminococcus sp.]